MNDGMSIKVIAKSWIHVILVFATILAGILLPIVATMNYESKAEALTAPEVNGETANASLLDEVEMFLDKVKRAQTAHSKTVSSASDMKSVVDELEASENALNETERANADSAYGVEGSASSSASADEIEDADVPLNASATSVPKSKSLIAPAR